MDAFREFWLDINIIDYQTDASDICSGIGSDNAESVVLVGTTYGNPRSEDEAFFPPCIQYFLLASIREPTTQT